MGAFALGLFLLGPFCSYLVQRYRRNMVCVTAIAFLAASIVLPLYLGGRGCWQTISLWRLLQGAAFGLAQMVLSSTLVIDTCESFRRTEANHSATWFGRFALSIGPLAGILLARALGFEWVVWGAAGCCVLSAVLILMVHFPFRVPSDGFHLLSLDRFLLTSGWPLLLFLFVFTGAVGLLLSLSFTEHFYGMLMVGFWFSLLAQRYAFPNADLKSEVVTGLILAGTSVLILLTSPHSLLFSPMLGFGIGMVGSRFLLFFIKLSHHCQRGTSQSTFMLGWESGLAIGVAAGYWCFDNDASALGYTSLSLIVVLLSIYVLFLHGWFLLHRTR